VDYLAVDTDHRTVIENALIVPADVVDNLFLAFAVEDLQSGAGLQSADFLRDPCSLNNQFDNIGVDLIDLIPPVFEFHNHFSLRQRRRPRIFIRGLRRLKIYWMLYQIFAQPRPLSEKESKIKAEVCKKVIHPIR
jgi:hypothetical protein